MKKIILILFSGSLFVAVSAHAEISTDGSLGAVQHLSGQMTIPQSLGTTVGNNLFHSFQTFNINSGESATFTGSNALQNVISRVTGGQISIINGLLKSEVGNANFYLINPAGVTFGANAQVDVPAAFHVSTANYLKFADGTQFSASNLNASTLTIAEPTDFGFLGNQLGDIDLHDNSLSFTHQKVVSFNSSRDVILDNATLSNPSGAITFNAKQSLSFSNHSSVNASTSTANAAGDISLTAADILINSSNLISNANVNSTANAGTITLNAAKTLTVDANGISGNAGIFARTLGTGNAGMVMLNSDTILLSRGAVLSTSTLNAGNGGDVKIQTRELTIDSSSVSSNTNQSASGNAGNISVSSDNIRIKNGGFINSTTFASGNAGTINLQTKQLLMDGGDIFSNAYSTGNAGAITVNSEILSIKNGAIGSSTWGTGNAGTVNVQSKALTLDEGGGLYSLSGVRNGIRAKGNASSIKLNSDTVTLKNGGEINSSTDGQGAGGNVSVQANVIDISGSGINRYGVYINSRISAGASVSSNNGQTGHLNVVANQAIHLHDHGEINTTNDVTLADDNAAALVKGGELSVFAPEITLDNGAKISTRSTGNIGAAQLNVAFSDNLSLRNNAFITTQSNLGNGGHIKINGNGLILLKDSGFLTSVSGANSNGGNITVSAAQLVMNTGVIQANAIGGSGGNINLNLNALIPSKNQLMIGGAQLMWQPFISGFNVIQAASANGVNGAINLTSPQFNISGSISGLKSARLIIPSIDRSLCQNSAALFSNLSRGGKGGLPYNEAQYSFIPMAKMFSASVLSNNAPSSVSPLAEKKTALNNSYPCTPAAF